MTYHPEAYRWLSIKQPDDSIVVKVFASWTGSYLHGDSWKLNSGCLRIEDNEDELIVHGYSGSIYILNKNDEGMLTSFTASVLDDFLTRLDGIGRLVSYEEVKEIIK